MAKSTSFRVGKVRADLRGKTWYLTYLENGRRLRPRVGTDRDAARQLAAQVNAQLKVSAPTAFGLESIRIDELCSLCGPFCCSTAAIGSTTRSLMSQSTW